MTALTGTARFAAALSRKTTSRPLGRVLARAVVVTGLIAGGALVGGGCKGGKVLFDAADPKGCATGNGCPTAICTCADKSFVIDSTCELGKCSDANTICADRCEPFGGPSTVVTSASDDIYAPGCETLDERMYVNKCNIGTDLLSSSCTDDATGCTVTASSFWNCVVGRGILSCRRGGLHVDGCNDETPEFCSAPPASP